MFSLPRVQAMCPHLRQCRAPPPSEPRFDSQGAPHCGHSVTTWPRFARHPGHSHFVPFCRDVPLKLPLSRS